MNDKVQEQEGKDDYLLHTLQCPVCGSEYIEKYLDTDLTSFFFPVPATLIQQVKKEPISLRMCTTCSHIFQTNIRPELLDLIYGEFYSHYNLDTSIEFQEVYRERTLRFMEKVIPNGERMKMLDIGCGEGTYFPFFEHMGYKCYGIEPSKKAKIAKEKNPNAYVSSSVFENCDENTFGTTFDIILMNWALEHMINIEDVFIRLRKLISLGSRIVIQVPDMQYYMNNDLALFFVHEHIQYFTVDTLRTLLERNGYKIIRQEYGDRPSVLICGEYIGCVNRGLINLPESVKEKKDFLDRTQALKLKVEKLVAENDRIVLYGMGLVAFWISEFCVGESDLSKFVLIDDNQFYHGKMIPSFNKELSVFPPLHDMTNALIIITTSPVYHDKIRGIIRRKFKGNYRIATFNNSDVVIEHAV